MQPSPLIEAEQAISRLGNEDTVFVDATWYLPNVSNDGRKEFERKRIPGAIFYDIDEVADPRSDLPHMYPTAERFEQCVGNMGISSNSRLIVYDRSNYIASARAWWMFKSFGHPDVKVLNGCLKAWERCNGPTESGPGHVSPCAYSARSPDDFVVEWKELAESLNTGRFSLLDARSEGRFSGADPEPRPGLRGGHIPGSLNLYYGDVINSDGTIRSASEIASALDALKVSEDRGIVTTCGSGVTAAILLLAICQTRRGGLRLYDGSWTEWASNPDSPQ